MEMSIRHVRNLSLGRRHLVNAYEVKADIDVAAGKTVWSMPERLECEVQQKECYMNTLTLTLLLPSHMGLANLTLNLIVQSQDRNFAHLCSEFYDAAVTFFP